MTSDKVTNIILTEMRLLLLFYLFVCCSKAEDVIEEPKPQEFQPSNEQMIPPTEMYNLPGSDNVIKAIESMEQISASAEKSRREGILPEDHSEELYDKMVETLIDLIELLKNPHNTYKFLNKKGVDRIITPIIGVNYDPLKKQLLILIKTLFTVTPTTTNVLIPASIIDKLLDIFEHDDNLALKAHALDIMSVWLPNNPLLQTRVMRLKGLEPFYHQVKKLDISVVQTLLDLFNKIFKEHLDAKNNRQKSRGDFETRKMYEVIGLVELVSTPNVCNGLLNIIESLVPYRVDNECYSSIFELVKNIKPFCVKIYKGQAQAIKVFDDLNNYIAKRNDLFENLHFNYTEIRILLEEYARDIKKTVRDEF